MDTFELRKRIKNGERPKDHKWIRSTLDISEVYSINVYTCSECGSFEYTARNYCPECGTRLEGVADE